MNRQNSRIVNVNNISDIKEKKSPIPLLVKLAEKQKILKPKCGGGHQTYSATGPVQDISWDPD
jgi:hypothetical protein